MARNPITPLSRKRRGSGASGSAKGPLGGLWGVLCLVRFVFEGCGGTGCWGGPMTRLEGGGGGNYEIIAKL